MCNVSLFKDLANPKGESSIEEIINRIRSNEFMLPIQYLQRLLKEGNKKEYDSKKKLLHSFTPCGVFENRRLLPNLKCYSGLVILDIDKLEKEALLKVRDSAEQISFTHALFYSPSGTGLKILVKVSSGKEDHLKAFNSVKQHYEEILKVIVDKSGKDITRLCFMSYDETAMYTEDSEVFKVENVNDVEADVKKLVDGIEQNRIDLTSDYISWRNVGFALAEGLGESGRGYFHRISRFNAEYDQETSNEQYTKCLNASGVGSDITLKTLFYMAKQNGLKISSSAKASIFSVTKNMDLENIPNDPKDKGKVKKKKGQVKIAVEKKKERRVATNRFHLAKNYLEKHFDIRHNKVSMEFEFREKGEKSHRVMNENSIFIKMQLDGLNISLNNLVAYLKSDYIESYNPFFEYFESLPAWDECTDYIQELASFVKVSTEERVVFDNHFTKWLVRMVKCSLVDDYFNKQAFILVQPKQNSGKSTFCRFLCPPRLKNYIAENPSIDKDSRILLTTNLIINLDELSTFSKVEINSLKSLFSKDKINDRLPYDRKNSIIPRRASFIGSTNQTEFLNDESGSVRWLCFMIEDIDWDYKDKINIDLVYSQAYFLFLSGWQCDFTQEEIIANDRHNSQFNTVTSEKELIERYFKPADKSKFNAFMTATEILIYISGKTDNRVRLNTTNIGKGLRALGFIRERKSPEWSFGYYVILKK